MARVFVLFIVIYHMGTYEQSLLQVFELILKKMNDLQCRLTSLEDHYKESMVRLSDISKETLERELGAALQENQVYLASEVQQIMIDIDDALSPR